MIAKGNCHNDGLRLARYLVTEKRHEYAELWELRGFAARDLTEAFRTVQVIAKASRCEKPFFHVQIRNPKGETLSRIQWDKVADWMERILGLRDQPRAVAVHIDRFTGHEHLHIAWSRIVQETLKARPLPFFKLRLKKASRELEIELGLTVVKNKREDQLSFAPTRAEDAQARRLGVDVHHVRTTIHDCYQRSDCGRSFLAALSMEGLILARGDQRDYIVVDRAGGMHALGKRILGTPAADMRTRLADVRREQLPTLDEARCSIRTQTGSKDGPAPAARTSRAAPAARDTNKVRNNLQGCPVEPNIGLAPGLSNEAASALDEDSIQAPKPLAPHLREPETDHPGANTPPPICHPTPGQNSERVADILKRHFRALVKALTTRSPSPGRQTRRRRRGETMGTFRLAASSLLRPVSHLPGVFQATAFLRDALTWLNLWEPNENCALDDISEGPDCTNDTDLSPRP